MAPCFSKYATKNNTCILFGLAAFSIWLLKKKNKKRQSRENVKYASEVAKANQVNSHVDLKFFRQLLLIIKIVIPGWTSAEAGYVLLVAAILGVRSLCDLWVVNYIATTESLLIAMERKLCVRKIFSFMAIMPILSVINTTLKYTIGELKIRMRKNLSLRLYKGYLNNITYYRLSNLDGRMPNVDHLLTTDVEKFCDCLAQCYSHICKPLLDIGVFTYNMTNISVILPVTILTYMVLSGVLVTYLRKPIGRLTITEQKLEGKFRNVNARILTYGEEIAFYNGNAREKMTLINAFNEILDHSRKFLHFHIIIGCVDKIIGKYSAIATGWLAIALALFGNYSYRQQNGAERTKSYYTYGRVLYSLAQAVGDLVLSGRELTRLASFTLRITELQLVLHEINNGKYDTNPDSKAGKLIIQDNIIQFDKVPIVTPNGDVLIKELTIKICPGTNVLICGPNGAGKSSIFRILGELWPLSGGELTKPHPGKLFYIPQKPYMTLGSLRDQITYPLSAAEAKLRGCTDEQLKSYLKVIQLEYLLDREGGLDVVTDWLDVLSGGEKQRIAMARLLYHAPQFAILDECTSAVAVDIENAMYSHCRNVGITLLTVSHRKSLWKHHEYVLYLNGRGSYTFKPIVEEMEKFGS